MEHDTVQLNPATDHSSRPRIGTRVAQWLGSAKLTHSSTARWEAPTGRWLLWEADVSPQLWRLYELEPPLLHSLLHPLCNYLLFTMAQTPAAQALEALLLRACAASLPFALELLWLLQAQPSMAEQRLSRGNPPRAAYVRALLRRVLEVVDVEEHVAAELRFVDRLTAISDRASVEKPQRCAALRDELVALNATLPTADSTTLFLRARRRGAPPHQPARVVDDEAVVLSTKERVPYLIFVEVVEADAPAVPLSRKVASTAGQLRRSTALLPREVAMNFENLGENLGSRRRHRRPHGAARLGRRDADGRRVGGAARRALGEARRVARLEQVGRIRPIRLVPARSRRQAPVGTRPPARRLGQGVDAARRGRRARTSPPTAAASLSDLVVAGSVRAGAAPTLVARGADGSGDRHRRRSRQRAAASRSAAAASVDALLKARSERRPAAGRLEARARQPAVALDAARRAAQRASQPQC